MATVSGKHRFTLVASLLTVVCVSGCNTLMPVKRQASDAESGVPVKEQEQRMVVRALNTPLPKQAYDSKGGKIAYAPQPNPYTQKTPAVPSDARSAFVVASAMLQQGNLQAARLKFEEMTEKYPSLSGPWVKLGTIAEKEEKYEEAVMRYRKAITVNGDNVNAYIALGLLQRRLGEFGAAQASYSEALEVWRDFPEAHLNLAILYDLYVNQPEQAQKHYEAYYFLTGNKGKKVHKWLVEVKQRTGIERSFIDSPPKGFAVVKTGKSGDAVKADTESVQAKSAQ